MARRPTPSQIARYGHIAAFLREQLPLKGWANGAEFNKAFGLSRGNPSTYKWLAGTGGPSEKYRKKLAEMFQVEAKFFEPRLEGAERITRRGRPPKITARTRTTPRQQQQHVLEFHTTPTGDVHIRLDAVMPLARAVPLLSMLTDARLYLTSGTAPENETEDN